MQDSAEHGQDKRLDCDVALESVKAALSDLKFGAIQLTIHEGRVVQLDVTERHRFPL